MKQFKVKFLSNSIEKSIVGKATFAPVESGHKSDFILFHLDEIEVGSGYAAIVVTNVFNSISKLTGHVVLIDQKEIEHFNYGDVISIEKNGVIRVIYKKTSLCAFLVVTERCNCACIMCPNPVVIKDDEKVISTLKAIPLIDKDIKLLCITGGEPTLIGDKLIDVINACKQNIPQTELILMTNGIHLEDFNYVKEIVSIKHQNLAITIPLYSDIDMDHDYIIGARGFYKTIKGLHILESFGQRIIIKILIHKLNYKRLFQMAEFVCKKFCSVRNIVFMQMETSWREFTTEKEKKNIEELYVDPYDYSNNLERSVLYLNKKGIDVVIYNLQLCVLPTTIWEHAKKTPSWESVYIDECYGCYYKKNCYGFLPASLETRSRHIKPLQK